MLDTAMLVKGNAEQATAAAHAHGIENFRVAGEDCGVVTLVYVQNSEKVDAWYLETNLVGPYAPGTLMGYYPLPGY